MTSSAHPHPIRRLPGTVLAARALRYLFDAEFRDGVHLRLLHGGEAFQIANKTWDGRYPHVFALLADRLGNRAAPRILSFGCSTGSEVARLREVLPSAHIVGLDISRRNIRVARAGIADPSIRFVQGGSVPDIGEKQYDAILCLAVLQDANLTRLHPRDSSVYLRFDKFERAILDLDRHLMPGGLLALYHTNFRLADTSVGADYEPILSARPHAGDRVKYGPDNRLTETVASDRVAVFRKRGPG